MSVLTVGPKRYRLTVVTASFEQRFRSHEVFPSLVRSKSLKEHQGLFCREVDSLEEHALLDIKVPKLRTLMQLKWSECVRMFKLNGGSSVTNRNVSLS